MNAVVSENRQGGSSVGQDLRTREGHVNVVEDSLLQGDVGPSHPGGNLVVHVDDVMARPPVVARVAVRQGSRMSRSHVPACDSPRSGHDFLGPRESQVERRRACLASPRDSGSLERLLEIHHARRETLIVDPREGSESGGEVRQAKRVNLFLFREAEHAKGGCGHDAQGSFRADEETFQVETRRGSGDGPSSNHASVREDGLEAKDLISHRSAKIAGIADAVRPDGPADGGARPGPGIVSKSETMPPELTE